jgi:hypothetical protein
MIYICNIYNTLNLAWSILFRVPFLILCFTYIKCSIFDKLIFLYIFIFKCSSSFHKILIFM